MTKQARTITPAPASFQQHPTDTGSVEVQVARLTERINQLNDHFTTAPKDYASKTGLMKLVGRRRRFLEYLQRTNKPKYAEIIAQLGLRK